MRTRFRALNLGQSGRHVPSSQSLLTNGYLRQPSDTSRYAQRQALLRWLHACNRITCPTQLSVSLIYNLIYIKDCSSRVRTERVPDRTPKNARLAITPSHCFLSHDFAVFNLMMIPRVFGEIPMPCWASIHVSLSVLLPALLLHVFGLERGRAWTQGWQWLWGDSLRRLTLSSGNRN